MTYKNAMELPESIKNALPTEEQEVYLKEYNKAWEEFESEQEERGKLSREETAHRIAWSSLKKRYEINEDQELTKKMEATNDK